jgi:hypothetical protein
LPGPAGSDTSRGWGHPRAATASSSLLEWPASLTEQAKLYAGPVAALRGPP